MLNELAAQVEVVEPEHRRRRRRYAQAQALVREQRAALFPTRRRSTASARRAAAARRRRGGTGDQLPRSSLGGELGARRLGPRCAAASTARSASAQASAADLAAARLSAQGELATDYFALREADAEIALLARHDRRLPARAADHAEPLRRRHRRARPTCCRRRPSSPTTRADLAALERQRAQLEHAIAVLVGKAPADFTLRAGAVERDACRRCRSACRRRCCSAGPTSPRPSARVAAANAQIGIAARGLLPEPRPERRRTAPAGSTRRRPVQRVEQRSGRSACRWRRRSSMPARRARSVDAARRPARDAAVARYRQTVLTAFQARRGPARRRRALAEQEACAAPRRR